jgi:hypothetical protein
VRNVATYTKHVPVEKLEVVDATVPQGREHYLHGLLCKILGFRYTAQMSKAVQPCALPKTSAKLGFGGPSLPLALLDPPGQLRIAGVLPFRRCHERSLPDLFL